MAMVKDPRNLRRRKLEIQAKTEATFSAVARGLQMPLVEAMGLALDTLAAQIRECQEKEAPFLLNDTDVPENLDLALLKLHEVIRMAGHLQAYVDEGFFALDQLRQRRDTLHKLSQAQRAEQNAAFEPVENP